MLSAEPGKLEMTSDKAHKTYKEMQDDAVRWHIVLSGDEAGEEDWLAFTDWLEADDKHRKACDAVEDILIGVSGDELNMAELSPLPPENTVIEARHRWWGRGRQWAVAVAAIAAIVIIVTGVRSFRTADYGIQEYATRVGEQRMVTLSDGSTVRLNTDSGIKVMFEDKVRRTELTHGQALFTIAKNAKRPFLVGLGDSHVRVVGTVFDILRHKNQVRVTVAKGVVEVVPTKTTLLQKTVRLLPGSQLIHREGSTESSVTKVDPAVVTAWKNGYLEYDDARLADVVDDLNRYFPAPIRVIGTARDLRFSGVVRIADEKAALLILSEGLPVYVENRQGEMLVLPDAN